MALINDQKSEQELQEAIKKQQEFIQQKRELTGDPEWQPLGGDHGPGLMPEEEWEKYHPESNPETALHFNNEGGVA